MKFRTAYVDTVRRAKFVVIMEIDELMNINNRVCRSVKMNINQTKFDQFTNEFKIFRTYENINSDDYIGQSYKSICNNIGKIFYDRTFDYPNELNNFKHTYRLIN